MCTHTYINDYSRVCVCVWLTRRARDLVCRLDGCRHTRTNLPRHFHTTSICVAEGVDAIIFGESGGKLKPRLLDRRHFRPSPRHIIFCNSFRAKTRERGIWRETWSVVFYILPLSFVRIYHVVVSVLWNRDRRIASMGYREWWRGFGRGEGNMCVYACEREWVRARTQERAQRSARERKRATKRVSERQCESEREKGEKRSIDRSREG